jgi:hypothetical protein
VARAAVAPAALGTVTASPEGGNVPGSVGSGRSARLRELRSAVSGSVVLPADPGYEGARRVWNDDIDRRPVAIAYCESVADVQASVRWAAVNDVPVAVRSGGHSFPGHCVCDGGLVVDTSRTRAVRVDPAGRRLRAEAGAHWADVDRAAERFGLATVGGVVSHTGIAGLTLGGGIGYLSPALGLACDHLVRATVVSASGDLVVAADEPGADGDLLWGLRGGGGNFGVVSAFEYCLHPLPAPAVLLTSLTLYPFEHGPDVFRQWNPWGFSCRNMTTTFLTRVGRLDGPLAPFAGQRLAGVMASYIGDSAREGIRLLDELRAFGSVYHDIRRWDSYASMQTKSDVGQDWGTPRYYKGGNLDANSGDVADQLFELASTMVSDRCILAVRTLGGAISDIAEDATAFAGRSASHLVEIVAEDWRDPAERTCHVDWVRSVHGGLSDRFSPGAYIADRFTEVGAGEDEVRIAYAGEGKYERLVALKTRLDPDNLFRSNANIRPQGWGGTQLPARARPDEVA